MATAPEIVSSLHRKGAQLWLHWGVLHYQDPESALSLEEIDFFTEQKIGDCLRTIENK